MQILVLSDTMGPMQKLSKAKPHQIDEFIRQTDLKPQGAADSHIVFAMDATASRAPTWEMACRIQGQMFIETQNLTDLAVQLVYYRGYDECRASRWHRNSDGLLKAMQSVQCIGGTTQIERVLKHCLNLISEQKIHALIFVGDCLEENPDVLCQLAGKLALFAVPVFIFQEGNDAHARNCFQQICKITNGAYSSFDQNSADQLKRLLSAVAVYTASGKDALKRLNDPLIKKLTHQLR